MHFVLFIILIYVLKCIYLIKEIFICGICLDVIKSPKGINAKCEHIFCEECITQAFNNLPEKRCPRDNTPLVEPYFVEKPSRYWSAEYLEISLKCQFESCDKILNPITGDRLE